MWQFMKAQNFKHPFDDGLDLLEATTSNLPHQHAPTGLQQTLYPQFQIVLRQAYLHVRGHWQLAAVLHV